jgi:hypothetical protein
VAQSLFVTTRTVEVHLTNTYRKLGIGSRHELSESLRSVPLEPAGTVPLAFPDHRTGSG